MNGSEFTDLKDQSCNGRLLLETRSPDLGTDHKPQAYSGVAPMSVGGELVQRGR